MDDLIKYSDTWKLLLKYDKNDVDAEIGVMDTVKMTYKDTFKIINKMKETNDDYFGIERNDSFKNSIENIYSTFLGEDLYPTLELKAANLLYSIVKNHPFVDGNKRIAGMMFIYLLSINEYENLKNLNDETLALLIILTASSKPEEKDNMINVILLILKHKKGEL